MVRYSAYALMAAALSVAACKPEFEDRNSEVSALRVLAVSSTPAEARTGTPISYRALVADQAGARPDVAIDWAFCSLPKPATELNDVAVKCFSATASFIKPFGPPATSATGTLPADTANNGCNLFGPDNPPAIEGQPPSRPADPDETGGYYQPLRLLIDVGGSYLFTLAQTRLACGLPGATGDVFAAFRKRYRFNENPHIDALVAYTQDAPQGTTIQADTDSITVRASEQIRITAAWTACPTAPQCGDGVCGVDETADACAADCTDPKGCTGAEQYVYYDLVSRGLVDRREAMRLSWYSNAGVFRDDRTGRSEQEADQTTSENVWTAPGGTTSATIWLVLRDNRGGVSWRSFNAAVR
jgi:hypothetical protein